MKKKMRWKVKKLLSELIAVVEMHSLATLSIIMLKQTNKYIKVIVDGLAILIAFVIAMVEDTIVW